jgi:hypothetical protein
MKKQFFMLLMVMLMVPAMLSAIVVGLNDDVHFNYNGEANDFHIEGIIHSAGGVTPLVTSIMVFGDPGTGNWQVSGYSLVNIGPEDWYFKLDFKTDGFITYCQWIHFGIKFDVKAKNIIARLKGWWTLDGNPIFKSADQYQQVAVTGFEVAEDEGGKFFKIMNDTDIPVEVKQAELVVTNYEVPLIDMYTTGLGRPGEISPKYPQLTWKDINQYLPSVFEPGQHFKIYLSQVGIYLQPGQFLQVRGEQVELGEKNTKNKNKSPDWGWFWEQHGE